jgi:hypothetical protein
MVNSSYLETMLDIYRWILAKISFRIFIINFLWLIHDKNIPLHIQLTCPLYILANRLFICSSNFINKFKFKITKKVYFYFYLII